MNKRGVRDDLLFYLLSCLVGFELLVVFGLFRCLFDYWGDMGFLGICGILIFYVFLWYVDLYYMFFVLNLGFWVFGGRVLDFILICEVCCSFFW